MLSSRRCWRRSALRRFPNALRSELPDPQAFNAMDPKVLVPERQTARSGLPFPTTGCSGPSIAISTVKAGRSQSSTSGVDDPRRRIREVDIPRTLDTTQSRHSRRSANPSTGKGRFLSTSSANTEANTEAMPALTTGTFGGGAGTRAASSNRSKPSTSGRAESRVDIARRPMQVRVANHRRRRCHQRPRGGG